MCLGLGAGGWGLGEGHYFEILKMRFPNMEQLVLVERAGVGVRSAQLHVNQTITILISRPRPIIGL